MSTWAQRVHRRAADLGSVVTSCGHPGPGPYPYRLEKVKFGVPLNEVCKNDIPGPLLVLILKLNKEAPQRKDVFRAPGNQSAMKKLIHFLQAGRLVNVDNFSVYTIASVLKKFLRKIPNGIFGRNGEDELFAIVDIDNDLEQQERIHRLITSLPIYTQRLLVLLFGTFRVIASNAERAGTGMTSEALGVSVAPSFFQSCVSDGKTARMEDVLRYKAEVNVATRIMKKMIDQFATFNLFGRDNYEFYARVTGRILKVEDEWICSFRFPPPPRGELAQQHYALQLSLEAGKTWLQCECERWGLIAQEESQSTPALLTSSSSAIGNSALSIGIIPELSLLESCARLSVSLEGPGVFAINSTTGESTTTATTNIELSSSQSKIAVALAAAAVTVASTSTGPITSNTGGNIFDKRSSFSINPTLQQGSTAGLLQSSAAAATAGSNGMKHSSSCSSTHSSKSASAAGSGNSHHHMTMDELRAVNRYAESTKSLSYLPQFNIDTTKSSSTTPTATTQSHVTSSHKNQSQSSLHQLQHKIAPLSSTSLLSSSLSSSSLLKPLVVNNIIAGKKSNNIEIKNSCCVIIDSIEKVHERQTQRMKTRSEWFLESGGVGVGCSSLELSQYNTEFFGGSHNDIQEHHHHHHQYQLPNTNTMFLMLHHQQQQQQQQQNHLLHPHHISSFQHNQHLYQQQHHHIDYLQRMDTSADEQDSINNTANNQQHDIGSTGGIGEFNRTTNQQQPPSMMFLMDTNFPPMSGSYNPLANTNANAIKLNHCNHHNKLNDMHLNCMKNNQKFIQQKKSPIIHKSINNHDKTFASSSSQFYYSSCYNNCSNNIDNINKSQINSKSVVHNYQEYPIGTIISRIEASHGDGPHIIIRSPAPIKNNESNFISTLSSSTELISLNESIFQSSNQSILNDCVDISSSSLASSVLLINNSDFVSNGDGGRCNLSDTSNTISSYHISSPPSSSSILHEEEIDYTITAHSRHTLSAHRRNRNIARNQLTNLDIHENNNRHSIGNIGLSASAESVQYPVKRPSRRGPSYTRHHPHRSSSHRNKENGKSSIGNTTNSGSGSANGSGTGSGGGPGNNSSICTITSDAPVAVRSNSFRQKKSNRECNCSDNLDLQTGAKFLRKSRAVSFDKTTILLPHPKVSLTPASQISGNNSASVDGSTSARSSIDENCETIILMDTTEEESSSILLQSIILDTQLKNSNSSINNLNTKQQLNNAGISALSNTSIDKLSTNLLTSSPSIHFKPPRV